VYGIELPPGVLADECGQVTDTIVLQKESRTPVNINCPYVVDISTFTDDDTTYIPNSVYISEHDSYMHVYIIY